MTTKHDVAIVGAGFAGMYLLHRLREAGFAAHVYEAADDVGGTWFWNRYPGARCDSESMQYSYSFSRELEQEWEWSERFATQPEILRYLSHVAERFDLRRDITFGATVASATSHAGGWTVELESGERVEAQHVVLATGCLSTSRTPDFPGLENFAGTVLHTGDWPHEPVDLAGRRIGVIGTGSSGVQAIPLLAAQAESLTVFQRTPNFTLPARNAPLDPVAVAEHKGRYPQLRDQQRRSATGTLRTVRPDSALDVDDDERASRYERGWRLGGNAIFESFDDLSVNAASNDTLAEFLRGKIREIVRDEQAVTALTAQDYPVGAKRICIGTDYYETYNRDNVALVDLRAEPIEAVTATGLRTSEGEYELDVLVLATGFDAMTGSILRIDVRGTDGRSLREDWSAGPHTYLGLAMHGYPNLFTVTGPGSPSVLGNVVVSIEQHVEWISEHLVHLRDHGLTRSEARLDDQERWVAQVNEVASQTLMTKAASWYMGANVPGKPQVFMPYAGGFAEYRRICDEETAAGYSGFRLS
ncbi:NAD(P)/FAD-dependent oxidoreductase [Pseudonocardia ailaonensis]|uniref:NAD(P)/FAD-dependent oxidoreductase n=1 Tax=Pseudonocardia ailaonensis TaxID=367279 RepID=A0ABN2MVE2_9PSEU